MSQVALVSDPFGFFDNISTYPHPFALKSALESRLDNCFDSCKAQRSSSASASASSSSLYRPAFDIIEDPTSFKVTADLPGISKDSIQINFTDNALTISGQRKPAVEEADASVQVEESETDARRADDVNGQSGEKQEQEQERNVHAQGSRPKSLLNERPHGHFSRTFRFSERADLAQTSASHVDGVLRLVVPKRAPVQSSILIR